MALREMRELMLLPGTVITADATPAIEITAAKFTRMLNNKLFSIKAVEVEDDEIFGCTVEGMQHINPNLSAAAGFEGPKAAQEFATSRSISLGHYSDWV